MTGRRRTGWLALVALASAASGCGESRAAPLLCAGAPCPVERTVNEVFQLSIAPRLALLLVVDDTPTAKAFAADLPAAAAKLAQSLRVFPGGLPTLRLAVVPASRADGAAGCASGPGRAAACGVAAPGGVVANGPCGAAPNITASLEDTVSCLAEVGTEACGAFEPFTAVRRALGGAPDAAALPGFLQPDWPLMVAIVAGRDDASTRDGAAVPVDELVTFLKGLASEHVTVSVLGPAPDCGHADAPSAAPRLQALATAFRWSGAYERACAPSFSFLSGLFGYHDIGAGCFTGLRDTDLSRPGLQAECAVETTFDAPDATVPDSPHAVPSCDVGPPPCWRAAWKGPFCSPGASFQIDRGPGWCPQGSTTTRASCLGCAAAGDPACVAQP